MSNPKQKVPGSEGSGSVMSGHQHHAKLENLAWSRRSDMYGRSVITNCCLS